MYKSNISKMKNIFIYLFAILLFSTCIKDEDANPEDSRDEHLLKVSVANAKNEDVSEVVLYIFDKDKLFIDTLKTTVDNIITLNMPQHEKIFVVALGNSESGDQTLPTLNVGDPISKAYLTLKTSIEAGIHIANSPGDLFIGSEDISLTGYNCETIIHTLTINRRVASMTITTSNIQHCLGTADSDFHYLIHNTHGSLNFTGTSAGNIVVYKPKTRFNESKEFIAPVFYTLATKSEELTTVEIYKSDKLIFSTSIDKDGKPIILREGELVDVKIDFKCPEIEVSLEIKPWGEVNIDQEFEENN